jgi:hypothetical protein
MNVKRTKSIALAVVTGLTPLMMTTAPVFASTQQPVNMPAQSMQLGMSASTATAPVAGWLQIAPHSSQWFKFKYHYDNTIKKSDEQDHPPTQALVKLVMQNPSSVGFEIWDASRLQNPQYDHSDKHHRYGKFEPVGVGTPMFVDEIRQRQDDGTYQLEKETNPDVLIWAGGERASDTFYVVVKNTTDAPANYMLSVTGPDVTY